MCQTPRMRVWRPTRAGVCHGASSWTPGTWLWWGVQCCPRLTARGCGWCDTGRCPPLVWRRHYQDQSPPWTWSYCLWSQDGQVTFRRKKGLLTNNWNWPSQLLPYWGKSKCQRVSSIKSSLSLVYLYLILPYTSYLLRVSTSSKLKQSMHHKTP